MSAPQRLHLDKDKLKQHFDVSHFGINAILRGMQLTLVGASRALQNPDLFTSKHYKQAIKAVILGYVIRLLIALPISGIKLLIWLLSFAFPLDRVSWDDSVVSGLSFIEEHVLQAPLFFMSLMRYISPTLDDLFMASLLWVDLTYVQKHRPDVDSSELSKMYMPPPPLEDRQQQRLQLKRPPLSKDLSDPVKLRAMYYPPLKLYHADDVRDHRVRTADSFTRFLRRFARKAALSLAVYAASFVPYAGRLVLPAASFWTFKRAVGLGPASVIFGTGVLLPRRYLVVFLQSYYASRSLVRDLLEPYFKRIVFTAEEKRKWFRSREGLLFGFGIGFYLLLKVPLIGVLIYGIAEASTAYLITKVTDPPPPPSHSQGFAQTQLEWRNKQRFLSLSLSNLDALHDQPSADEKMDRYPAASSRSNAEPKEDAD
ncbi:hypothetical protein VTG60DRAFT_6670 [Thermothelomyces hinnuleus]